jgi:hypothetical protein
VNGAQVGLVPAAWPTRREFPAALAAPPAPAPAPAPLPPVTRTLATMPAATDAGPRPYAVAFKDAPIEPAVATTAVPPAAAAPRAATPGPSEPAPRPYAIAFLNEPAGRLAGPAAATPRKPGPAPRAGSLVLLDASGQADRVRSLRTRLSQLGWSAGAASVPQVAPVTTRTVVRFPAWRFRVAQALARTLPGPTQLQSCGRTCNFIQVLFGADVRGWRLAPGRLDAHQGARLRQ